MDTHLFLFGGGSPFTDGFASKFAKISLTLGGPVSILFIDRHTDYQDYLSLITKPLQENGLNHFLYLPLPTTTIEIAKEKIEKSAGIIILGGDTNKYVNNIVETSLADPIRNRFRKGVPVVGFSAGALISLDPCIISPKDNIEREFQVRPGLGLVTDVQIAVHFSEWADKDHLYEVAKRYPDKENYGIDENTGLYLKNGQVERMEGKGVFRIIGGELVKCL